MQAGDRLCEGAIDPHDMLKILGPDEVQEYLVNEIQEVYRLQGVKINDKHFEVIVRQMLQKVQVDEVGDTNFLEGEKVDKNRFRIDNERVMAEGGEPATSRDLLSGYHQSIAVDRKLHLGGLIPGDHQGLDRSGGSREGRPSAGIEGKRHYWSLDSGRYRYGISTGILRSKMTKRVTAKTPRKRKFSKKTLDSLSRG